MKTKHHCKDCGYTSCKSGDCPKCYIDTGKTITMIETKEKSFIEPESPRISRLDGKNFFEGC